MTYEELMFEFKHAKMAPTLGTNGEWNSLDYYEEGETALLHYTDMAKQPWVVPSHPLEHLWTGLLKEAVESKFIDIQLVYDHGDKGHIRKFR